MKKYNFENINEDEHVVPSLGVLPIKISDSYNFIMYELVNMYEESLRRVKEIYKKEK